MQIQPREYFTIARGLQDPTDLTTYYVQAVVRNARTDEVIDTVNLVDNGNRRFTKPWQAPADVSGDGLYILITISVYTDAGYSVRAENYGDSFDEHLVQARPTPAMMHAGPDSPDIDYKKIQKMIDAAVGDIKFPVSKPVSLAEVETVLHQVLLEVRQIDIPEARPTDLYPVIQSIDQAKKDLIAVIFERPKFEKTDLSGIKTSIEKLTAAFENVTPAELKTQLNGVFERIKTFFDGDIEMVKKEVKSISDFLNTIQYLIPKTENSNTSPKASEPVDHIALANAEAEKANQ